MQIRIANSTPSGGDVQLWPLEWRAILASLPANNRRGQQVSELIKANVLPGAIRPVRITMTNEQIEVVRKIADLTP